MELHTIGIDLGKTVFHLVGLNRAGEVVVRKKCSRLQLVRFAQLFMTSVRTIRRWELREFSHTPNQQWFLGLLDGYVKRRALRRFAGASCSIPLYRKPGRPVYS